MRHAVKYLLLLSFCFLFLTACGPEPAEGPVETFAPGSPAVSDPTPDVPTPDVPDPEPDVPTPAASDPDLSVPELPVSLTEEDKAAAYNAAMDYYAGTVFEVHSLTQIDAREGEITFQTVCAKGGVELPDRTISLERQEGTWTVVNEGY